MPSEEKPEELVTEDVTYSRSELLPYMGAIVTHPKTGEVKDGGFISDDQVTFRLRHGKLHGGKDDEGLDQPALQKPEGHSEYWEDGLLHRGPLTVTGPDGNRRVHEQPAVDSDYGRWLEYWDRGKLRKIVSFREDIKARKHL
jgi:hypothetical protein